MVALQRKLHSVFVVANALQYGCLVLYVFLSVYFFSSSYSFLKTYSYYTHIEIYNNKNSERSRIEEWTTMALLNFSPQATDPLPGGERSSMQRAHNKRKQNGSYLFFISM
jgi:hypothetical protein